MKYSLLFLILFLFNKSYSQKTITDLEDKYLNGRKIHTLFIDYKKDSTLVKNVIDKIKKSDLQTEKLYYKFVEELEEYHINYLLYSDKLKNNGLIDYNGLKNINDKWKILLEEIEKKNNIIRSNLKSDSIIINNNRLSYIIEARTSDKKHQLMVNDSKRLDSILNLVQQNKDFTLYSNFYYYDNIEDDYKSYPIESRINEIIIDLCYIANQKDEAYTLNFYYSNKYNKFIDIAKEEMDNAKSLLAERMELTKEAKAIIDNFSSTFTFSNELLDKSNNIIWRFNKLQDTTNLNDYKFSIKLNKDLITELEKGIELTKIYIMMIPTDENVKDKEKEKIIQKEKVKNNEDEIKKNNDEIKKYEDEIKRLELKLSS